MLNATTDAKMDQKKDSTLKISEEITGPAWDLSSEYSSLESPEFQADWKHVETLITKLSSTITEIRPLIERDLGKITPQLDSNEKSALVAFLQEISLIQDQAGILLWNLSTYLHCERSVDTKNVPALKLIGKLMELASDLDVTTEPVSLYLSQTSEETLKAYLSHPKTAPEEFLLKRKREFNDTLLSEDEETLLTRMRLHGIDAWGDLYGQISGQMKCLVKKSDGTTEEMGLAKAAGLIRDANENTRREAWTAIQAAWKTNEIACAGILNGLAGWRIEEMRRRSKKRQLHFLDMPLHSSRIRRETLDAMFSALQSEIETPRRALRAIARGLGKPQIDPWDTLAPAPVEGSGRRSFNEGLALIRDSFASVDAGFGEFVDTMAKNNWIEGRVLPNKSQGAYCTGFAKSRTPRVYQTYMGSISDIRTLAHELGHAYHSWVMRDLPQPHRHYPMTLAETASIFAETVFGDRMSESPNESDRFEIAWQNAESAAAFMINIPARFEFEKNFYEKRLDASMLTAEELGDLTDQAWQKWYGDTITQSERQYWMSKLHFSISGVSFYNYPYSFGYLFSLGIYALREELGTSFMPSYVALLRDTGRMTAEELAKAHLGEDLTHPDFWKKSIRIAQKQVEKFESLLNAKGPARLNQ